SIAVSPKLLPLAALLLIAGIVAADAAPAIPSSELPGRERERFTPSPTDRFIDPLASPRNAQPLWQWCDQERRGKKKSKRGQGCSALGYAPRLHSRRLLRSPQIRRYCLVRQHRQRLVERHHLLAFLAETPDRDRTVGCFLAADHEQHRHLGER